MVPPLLQKSGDPMAFTFLCQWVNRRLKVLFTAIPLVNPCRKPDAIVIYGQRPSRRLWEHCPLEARGI